MEYVCAGCLTVYPERIGWCWSCVEAPMLVPRGRPAMRSAALEGEPATVTARELAAQQWDLLPVPALPGVRIMAGALLVLSGPPGAGKSTLALSAAHSMDRIAVVVLAEEQPSAAVGERLQRARIRSAKMHLVARASVDQIVDLCRRLRARLLVIDSIQASTLTPADVRHLITLLRLDMVMVTSQVTKLGDMRGPRTLEHEADVVIAMESGGAWRVVKSRYSATGETGRLAL